MKVFGALFLALFSQLTMAQLNWEKRFATTTSGGVSLGSYKAGYLYYLDQFQSLNNPKRGEVVDQYTGASAGAINSLISGINSCFLKTEKIKDSLYWDVWSKASFWDLYDEKKVSSESIIAHENFEVIIANVFKKLNKGLPQHCEFILGLTVTHDKNAPYKINKNIEIPNIKNYIVIKVKGQGFKKSPKISNFLLDNSFPRQLLLPFGRSYKENALLLKNSILASASFPLAFSPMKLKICERSSLRNIKTCNKKNAIEHSFIDGGLLDNAPLLLNYRISRTRKKKHNYFYLNASNYNFPTPIDVSLEEEYNGQSAQTLVTNYFSLFVNSSRNQELLNFFEEYGGTHRNTIVTKTSLPPISTPMYAFFGFLDKSLREFDFNLGMADAKKMIFDAKDSFPVDRIIFPEQKIKQPWTLFNCVTSIVMLDEKAKIQCEKDFDLLSYDHKVILQISLNRVYDLCQKIESDKEFELCTKLKEVKGPNLVIKKEELKNSWKQKEDESEEKYILRQLEQYDYPYRDLHQKFPEEGITPSRKIYYYFKDVLKTFEEKQHETKKTSISFANSIALDQIGDEPIEKGTFLFIGNQIEIGKTFNYARYDLPDSLNLHYSLYIDHYNDWIGNTDDKLTLTPTLGFTYTPTTFGKSFNLSLSAQIGYQLSKDDDFGNKKCNLEKFDLHPSRCSSAKSYFHLLFTVWKRFSLKLGAGTTLRKHAKKRPYEGNFLFGFTF